MMFFLRRLGFLATLLPLLGGAKAPPGPLRLQLPLQCHYGVDCTVQNYVDDAPDRTGRDFQCHGRSYPRHDGTDFRLPSLAQQRVGVNVLAAARGTVLRVRDGVVDRPTPTVGVPGVTGEECGNGLVIAHGAGWETQYCHLARGSIIVRPGQKVKSGAILGRIGMSGDTEFPHVHLTVRHGGTPIDPFAYDAVPGTCGGGVSLWRARLFYQAGEVLQKGFASRPVSLVSVQQEGSQPLPRPTSSGPALIAFVQAIGLEKGDIQRIVLRAPDASIIADATSAALDHDKAQSIFFAGRKSPAAGWKPGVYQADYSVLRGGGLVIVQSFRIIL